MVRREMTITVEPAKRDDIPALARIEKSCASAGWSEAQLAEELEFDFAFLECARLEGEVIGFIDYHLTPGNVHINEIAVDERYRKCGAGRALLRHAENAARENGCEELTLEVSQANEAALCLYDAEGFSQIAVRRRFYGENDAKVLKKEL